MAGGSQYERTIQQKLSYLDQITWAGSTRNREASRLVENNLKRRKHKRRNRRGLLRRLRFPLSYTS
jgi:hypothetical protein